MSHLLIAYAENFASLSLKINFGRVSVFEFAEFILWFRDITQFHVSVGDN